jgi:predicted transposase YbfD/YdcC
MGCQKEIAAKVRPKEADYVLAVKENQPHLYEDLSDHFDRVLEDEELLPGTRRHVTKEKNRGREEHRTYIATPAPEGLRDRAAWRDLTSVGCVVSVVHRDGKETVEVRYFISSLKPNAKVLAKAVRGHRGIEIPRSDDPRSDNLCVAGRAGYHRRGGPARAGLVA